MELTYVLEILRKLPHPLTDGLDTYRSIPNSLNIKFHGGSLGKILVGVGSHGYVKNRRGCYSEMGGSTFVAHTLDYAMDIARKRTDPNIIESGESGGRFNPVTGRREEGFGIPAILAINIERYVPKRIDAKYCLRAVQINGPIELSDIVILFNHQEDHFPDFVDYAILAECQPYKTLKRRLEEAFRTAPFDDAGLNEYQLQFLMKNLVPK